MSPLTFCAAVCSLALPALAADWPQFLGSDRSGAASPQEKALRESFESEPKVLWQHEVGSGHAGPAVQGDRVFVFHRQKGEAMVQALNSATGKPLWTTTWPTAYRDAFGMDDGPRATPTVSGGSVFAHGADGVLSALDAATGKLLWRVDTDKDQRSPQGFFGRACAPLVAGDKVILATGGDHSVTAFHAADGQVAWATGSDEASYASPTLLTNNTMLVWLRNHLSTFSLSDGKLLAQVLHRPETDASVSAATPVKTNAGWFLTAEYDLGCSLWDAKPDGTLTKTWEDTNLLNCHYATPVHYQGHIYGFDGRQERGMTLRCLSLKDKRITWESPRVKGGTLIRVQDKLLVLNEEGELWIVRASPDRFSLLLTTQMLRSGHRSHAAYANGILYARDASHLVALPLLPSAP